MHRIVLMVVDHDGLGAEGVRREIESVRYPNHCISPLVMAHEEAEVKWCDGHMLNIARERFAAFCALFSRPSIDP